MASNIYRQEKREEEERLRREEAKREIERLKREKEAEEAAASRARLIEIGRQMWGDLKEEWRKLPSLEQYTRSRLAFQAKQDAEWEGYRAAQEAREKREKEAKQKEEEEEVASNIYHQEQREGADFSLFSAEEEEEQYDGVASNIYHQQQREEADSAANTPATASTERFWYDIQCQPYGYMNNLLSSRIWLAQDDFM